MPRQTLFAKFLVITLLLTLTPLIASSLILLGQLESITSRLSDEIADTSDVQASESLRMRAKQVAETVGDLLQKCENDLLFLARSRPDRLTLFDFYLTRRGDIWERDRDANLPSENRDLIPLYQSIALIDRHGQERIVIRDGRTVPENELRNVADPAATEFKGEDYFLKTRSLQPGRIHVTHLTGFHVTRQQQLQGAAEPEDAYNGEQYRGVVRFCTPLNDKNGRFDGILVISLDHRHLMEITQHIDPGRGYSTVFPSYKSGNYAFLFDDEGWVVTHPRFWYIRGVGKDGRGIPPYTERSSSTEVEAGLTPFKLDSAAFINPNFPKIIDEVRKHKTGYVEILATRDSKNIMAYAPILYNTGDYRTHGVFGGVTIAFKVDQYNDLIRKGSRLISSQLKAHRTQSSIILLITACLSAFAAWRLSRGIVKPLQELTNGVRKLAEGDTGSRVIATSSDEVGELAKSFNHMADELEVRKNNLLSTLDELRRSRLEIMDERNFQESILESITSAIITFSPDGVLTSINATAGHFLGNSVAVGMGYRTVYAGWEDMADRVGSALAGKKPYGREPLIIERNGSTMHFDVGFFPIGRDAEQGITVTMRDETEKERMREEMTRMDQLASLGTISAGIAHEIRNPLTGITLLLDDLHDRQGLDPDTKLMIGHAIAETERVERLISSLLSYSSPPRACFVLANLNTAVQEGIVLFRKACEKQGVELVSSCNPIPPFPFDPDQIRQLLLNLLGNALEAVSPGGRIAIGTFCAANCAYISVADTGPGIPEEDIPRLFEPFFTRKSAGTGLGLSIVQRIVEEHHGSIKVESNCGEGTVVTVELPMGSLLERET
ncbi:sensor protein ZraS [Geobacter sp. OR-1]|uniref:PAS domain-containing sensor histidine kinase n=1 Tax=Geobacter sp. OR-1 TaxID=1266765 RepID=UPI000543AAB0|nr:PAS domain-containing sensor histidine kinase [Geobacter sp. OR-1]GAM07796.1 sensor protein ZraS [Geobacter sp. OR-1]